MKKYIGIILLVVFFGCLEDPGDSVVEIAEEENQFDVMVPADFNWSSINNAGITVCFKCEKEITKALDNTLVELYDDNDAFIDALIVFDGIVNFNTRISNSTESLKFVSVATGLSVEVATDVHEVEFNIKDPSAYICAKVDSDGDGLFDAFDFNPNDANVSIVVDNGAKSNGLKSASGKSTTSATYTIFEDLWPSKGDYDFNDLVAKTTFSWTRGKSNYIEEISGTCDVEWIGAGMKIGLGFELFEAIGTNLYYLDDVIVAIDGAEIDKLVKNGVIVINNVHDEGTSTVNFTIKVEEKAFKDFVCVPYLFRTDDKSHQVRPFGAPPTQNQDMTLFHSNDDASPRSWDWSAGSKFKYPLEGDEAFYRTAENHPWGIEFISKNKFKPSKENSTILDSYPGFKDWAESGGQKEKTWYDEPE